MELEQRALLKGLGSVELQKLLQVVGALAEPRPQDGPWETAVEAASEAAQMFGHGNKAFSGSTGLSTGLLLISLEKAIDYKREVLAERSSHIL